MRPLISLYELGTLLVLQHHVTGVRTVSPTAGLNRVCVKGSEVSYKYTNDSIVRPSTFSNIYSETIGPIELKFHMEIPQDGGTKVC